MRRDAARLASAALVAGCLVLLVARESAAQGIVYDASSSGSISSSTSLSFSHTVGSGTNRYLVVGLAIAGDITASPVPTFNGTSMTLIKSGSPIAMTRKCRAYLYGLVAPESGTHTVSITANSTTDIIGAAVSYTGVHQTTPFGGAETSVGDSGNPSRNVTSAEGEYVIDAVCLAGTWPADSMDPAVPAGAVGSGQTGRWNLTRANVVGLGSNEPGASTVTMSWTITPGTAEYSWQSHGATLKPANATAVRLDELGARRRGARVRITWRTGFEVDNLGFHLHREEAGGRVRITPSLLDGSGLFAGPGALLAAGRSYAWDDTLAGPVSLAPRYWLEEIDMSGARTWHGPVVPVPGEVPHAAAVRPAVSKLLAALTPTAKSEHDSPRTSPWAPAPLVQADQAGETQRRLAATAAIKVGVDHEGWYEVSQAALADAGLDPDVDPRRLSVFVEGREIPTLVRGEADGSFDAADGIGFFARGQNAGSTDTRVYWVLAGDRPGRRLAIASSTGPEPPATPAPWGQATVERRPRTTYFAALLNGEESNFFGPIIKATPVTQALRFTRPAPEAGLAPVLEVGVQGVSLGPHAVAIEVGGRPLGTLLLAGRERRSVRATLPDPLPPTNQLEVSLRATGGESDVTMLDFLRLTYPRALVADGGAVHGSAPGGTAVALAGFSAGSEVQVLDVSDPDAPALLAAQVADAAGSVRVLVPCAGPRALFARALEHRGAPRFVTPNRPSHLNAAQDGADLVILGTAALLPAMDPFAVRREAEGWRIARVDVEDVYDEFSFGAKEARALQTFFARAAATWSRPPRAVVLAGDASFDPRDFLGRGDFDLVPTGLVDTAYIETSSDDWLVDFDGDGIADVPIGRLPARTPEELATMVRKVLAAPRFTSAAAAATEGRVLRVNDVGDSLNDFATSSAALWSAAPSWRVLAVGRDRAGPDTAAQLRQALRQDPLLVSYTGHGSEDLWAGGLLSSDVVPALETSRVGAFWATMTCLNGFFHGVYKSSLAEALLAHPTGGAFGVWASSGLTGLPGQEPMARAFIENLVVRGMTAGEAARRAKSATSDLDVRRTWILLGDPTWRLIAEQPAPMAEVGVSGGPSGGTASDGGVSGGTTPGPGDASAGSPNDARADGGGCACTTVPGRDGSGVPFVSVGLLALSVGALRRWRRAGAR